MTFTLVQKMEKILNTGNTYMEYILRPNEYDLEPWRFQFLYDESCITSMVYINSDGAIGSVEFPTSSVTVKYNNVEYYLTKDGTQITYDVVFDDTLGTEYELTEK